jgi:hypothetical protein
MSEQKSFGGYDHDSLQYHFYCGDIVGGCRLFHTNSLQHASLWVFDGNTYREFQNTNGRYDESADDRLFVRMGGLTFAAEGEDIVISLDRDADGEIVTIRLTPVREVAWSDTISKVVHQPMMEVELLLDGKTLKGVGYCKRYTWTPAPQHWGYRFIQGFVDEGQTSVWTAEATFGLEKYDYFKIMDRDGDMLTTPDDISCHRLNGAYGLTSEGPVRIMIEKLSTWDVLLNSDRMSSRMQQRACRMTVRSDTWEKHGFAINETCYGTLG